MWCVALLSLFPAEAGVCVGQHLPPTPNPSTDSSSSLDFILAEMEQASALVHAGCPVSPSPGHEASVPSLASDPPGPVKSRHRKGGSCRGPHLIHRSWGPPEGGGQSKGPSQPAHSQHQVRPWPQLEDCRAVGTRASVQPAVWSGWVLTAPSCMSLEAEEGAGSTASLPVPCGGHTGPRWFPSFQVAVALTRPQLLLQEGYLLTQRVNAVQLLQGVGQEASRVLQPLLHGPRGQAVQWSEHQLQLLWTCRRPMTQGQPSHPSPRTGGEPGRAGRAGRAPTYPWPQGSARH